MSLTTETLRTHRLLLTPLEPSDAAEMADVLAGEELYAFTGGSPPTLPELERVTARR